MPKKIVTLIIGIIGIFLGLFIFSRSIKRSHGPVIAPSAPAQAKTSQEEAKKTLKRETTATPPTAALLNDTQVAPRDRAKLLLGLDHSFSPEQITEFVTFINSDNPYSAHTEAIDPHSYQAFQFQKEASLRVLALRTLSQQLTTEQFSLVVESIQTTAKDESIKRVARQALEFKREGRNYFNEMKKAIQAEPLPE